MKRIALLLLLGPGLACVPPPSTRVTVVDSTFQGTRQFGSLDNVGAIATDAAGRPKLLLRVEFHKSLENTPLEHEPRSYPPGSRYRDAVEFLRATPGVTQILEYHPVFNSGKQCHLLLGLDGSLSVAARAVLDDRLQPAIIAHDDAVGRFGCYSKGESLSVANSRLEPAREIGLQPAAPTPKP